MWYKTQWRKQTENSKTRMWLLIAITVLCLADCIISGVLEQYPYVTNFLRPVVVLTFFS